MTETAKPSLLDRMKARQEPRPGCPKPVPKASLATAEKKPKQKIEKPKEKAAKPPATIECDRERAAAARVVAIAAASALVGVEDQELVEKLLKANSIASQRYFSMCDLIAQRWNEDGTAKVQQESVKS